jgi:hypothetical protein
MTLVAHLASCDGFTVDSPAGCLGCVEETWLDDAGHPAALALRTADGGRALLLADAVRGVDADAQEVFVADDAVLRRLEPPRVERLDDRPTASWRAGATVEPVFAAGHAAPVGSALVAARARTGRVERPLWHTVLLALACLALLVAAEIGLDFGIAYLVTGRLT